jgi:hypothetical protein
MHALAALDVSPWYQRHADDELAAVVGHAQPSFAAAGSDRCDPARLEPMVSTGIDLSI